MADEREHRALGAGDSITVRGKEYTLYPISMRCLCDIEAAALKAYKRDVLKTYTDNAELLGPKADALIERKFAEVSEWSLDNLPKLTAHDVRNVPINDEIRAFVHKTYDLQPESETAVKHLLMNALDTKRISVEEVTRITGTAPQFGRVRYDMWWISATQEGAALFTYHSLKAADSTITKDVVDGWPPAKVIEAAKIVERLTSVDAKNG